jgi:hypothetical protein
MTPAGGRWEVNMQQVENRCYDPETIETLRVALDEAWESLPPAKQALTSRTDLAERILALAAIGERDPIRLRSGALVGFETAIS